MDLLNTIHIIEPMKSHIYEPNISLNSLISLMLNYTKPRIIEFNLVQKQLVIGVLHN